MYPEMVNKMAAEVHSAFGGGRGDVTAGELKGLKYGKCTSFNQTSQIANENMTGRYIVNAFIMEVLRLYPPVPMKWVTYPVDAEISLPYITLTANLVLPIQYPPLHRTCPPPPLIPVLAPALHARSYFHYPLDPPDATVEGGLGRGRRDISAGEMARRGGSRC